LTIIFHHCQRFQAGTGQGVGTPATIQYMYINSPFILSLLVSEFFAPGFGGVKKFAKAQAAND
jgi:hypothetical protein